MIDLTVWLFVKAAKGRHLSESSPLRNVKLSKESWLQPSWPNTVNSEITWVGHGPAPPHGQETRFSRMTAALAPSARAERAAKMVVNLIVIGGVVAGVRTMVSLEGWTVQVESLESEM